MRIVNSNSGSNADGWKAQNDFSTWNLYWLRENDVILFFISRLFAGKMLNCFGTRKNVVASYGMRNACHWQRYRRVRFLCSFLCECVYKQIQNVRNSVKPEQETEDEKMAFCRIFECATINSQGWFMCIALNAVNLLSHFSVFIFLSSIRSFCCC